MTKDTMSPILEIKASAILGNELRIAIVGAGMGGLASALALAKAGFDNIDVYETASNLGFVGAGIQVAPNLGRILQRLGCWDAVYEDAVDIKQTSIRESSTGEELAYVDLSYIRPTYGIPHMVVHRASLAGAIYDSCKKYPDSIKFHFCETVGDVDFPNTRFKAKHRHEKNDRWVDADVILSADGVKSNVRRQMLALTGHVDDARDTGQAAYRIMLTRDQMKADPELFALIDSNTTTRWIGERRHIIAYPISSNTIYNISTAHPDTHFAAAPSIAYTTKGDKSALVNTYADFCPLVHKMLQLVPDGEICEWKLRVHAPLDTWVEGNVALVGDACHPTLPHMNQGAAQAIEDAAVLGVVLAKVKSKAEVSRALHVYEKVRKTRAETLVELAAASGRELQLGAGAAREERDKKFAALKAAAASGQKGTVPDKWADADVQRQIYGHDCWAEAERQYDELFAGLAS